MKQSYFTTKYVIFLISVFMLQHINAQQASSTIEIAIGSTFYDFIDGRGRKVAQANNIGSDGLHIVFDRQAPSSSFRSIAYDYYDKSINLFFGATDIAAGTGGVIANGFGDEALISYDDQGVKLSQDAGEANFSFSLVQSINGAFSPGIGSDRSQIVLSAIPQGNQLRDTLRISFDGGGNWLDRSLPEPDPLTTSNGTSTSAFINPENQFEFSFLITPDVTVPARNGSLVKLTTIDNGINWTSEEIHNDDNVYFGNTTYQVEDFSDINGVYDPYENYHIVTGAVQGFVNQTDPIFPILYWLEDSSNPEELTDPFYGRNPDSLVQQGLINFRPGNGLGNAYPQIARTNGEVLFVAWQQWEANPDGSLRTLVGTGGDEVFATDIWGTIITSYGILPPFKIAGQEGFSDVFPRLPETLEIVSGAEDSLIVELIYLRDTDPGVSVLGQNNESECEWVFVRKAYSLPIVGIGSSDKPLSITDFVLSQNYPNPFNPSTTISYSLRKRGQVTIDVFNITGGKVTTLVNQVKPVGEHSTLFAAENLPSGLYFYTISSNGVRLASKKMILIK